MPQDPRGIVRCEPVTPQPLPAPHARLSYWRYSGPFAMSCAATVASRRSRNRYSMYVASGLGAAGPDVSHKSRRYAYLPMSHEVPVGQIVCV